jgi:hypothetical protein
MGKQCHRAKYARAFNNVLVKIFGFTKRKARRVNFVWIFRHFASLPKDLLEPIRANPHEGLMTPANKSNRRRV